MWTDIETIEWFTALCMTAAWKLTALYLGFYEFTMRITIS